MAWARDFSTLTRGLRYKKWYLICLFILGQCTNYCTGQETVNPYKLILVTDKLKTEILPGTFKDTLALVDELKAQLKQAHRQGKLAANIDSIQYSNDTATAYLYSGQTYRFGKINFDSIPAGLLNVTGISATQYQNKLLEPQKITQLITKILTYAEDNGYPFASIGFKSSQLSKEGVLDARLIYNPGKKIIIDTIDIQGNATVNYSFILSYLGLKNKQLYNESAIKSISRKIRELPFLQEGQPWNMSFNVLKNSLYLYLDEKKSNQINALLGFQPNNLETGKFLWTADVQMLLNNTLGYGETFSAAYKNLQAKSPQLDIGAIVPYILGSKFAIDGKFEYFKRDSLFDRVTFEAGLRYQFSEKDYLRFSYQQYNNRVPNPDTAFVSANKRLSNNVDLSSRGFGLNYVMDRTDFSFNPRKGWTASLNVTALRRTIRKNDLILSINDGFDYNTLYDTVNRQPNQYRVSGDLQYFIPLSKQLVIRTAYSGAYIGGRDLFQNELYQIGGFKVLRGFDERSIFSNHYHIFTAELKAILGERSYFSLFSDYGRFFTQYNIIDLRRSALSFGTGLTLENKSGLFNIIVALGKFDQDPFRFRDAKIHFGYVTYF